MKKLLIFMGIVILAIIGLALFATPKKGSTIHTNSTNTGDNSGQVACTQEAKQCPDGSYVGRSGPQCKFADCPTSNSNTNSGSTTNEGKTAAALNQKILVNGVYITPIELLEDSRCPVNVNCIWAGKVRVKARFESGKSLQTAEISLTNSIVFLGKTISLLNVNPVQMTNKTISMGDYRFEFSVSSGNVSAKNGVLTGTMTVGPLCPSGYVGNACNPNSETYASRKISVYKSDQKTLVAVFTPLSGGKFTSTLPVGTYYLTMTNPVISPARVTGLPTTVTITSDTTSHIDINFDTGIR